MNYVDRKTIEAYPLAGGAVEDHEPDLPRPREGNCLPSAPDGDAPGHPGAVNEFPRDHGPRGAPHRNT